jgi:hypothetical protein
MPPVAVTVHASSVDPSLASAWMNATISVLAGGLNALVVVVVVVPRAAAGLDESTCRVTAALRAHRFRAQR